MILGGLLAMGMGVNLGLLGGGGSILAVPILIHAFGLDVKTAIATSLLAVGTTSLVAVVGHARKGNVCWRTGALFGVFAMVGAFVGGRSAVFVPDAVLLLLFATTMVVTAAAMLRAGQVRGARRRQNVWKIAVEGLVIGGFTGLVGAGGGFLIVPALVILGGLPIHTAIGTSLLVIALKSFAGLSGYLAHVSIDGSVASLFLTAAALGALVGVALSPHLRADVLRRAFAVLVLAMGAGLLFGELI
jgi:uncharacterized membrane protein YfcA